MSKRSFGELSAGNKDSLSQVLEHADELLRAAQALKQDLENLRGDLQPDAKIAAILSRHKEKIVPATQVLTQSDTSSQQGHGSHKSQKLAGSHQAVDVPPSALPAPNPTSLTRWTREDIPRSGLPPLASVLDPVLEQAALTHSGMVTKPTDMSYERLEWIGDAYLYLISSAYIYQTFPNLAPGRCAQLRERLIKNETLSEYTVQYGINKRTKFPVEFDLHGRAGGSQASRKSKKKALGDIFEAYVAAAILGDSTGLSRVAAWLKSLWSTALRDEIRREYMDSQVAPRAYAALDNDSNRSIPTQQALSPKIILAQTIGAKGVTISYTDIGEPTREKHSGLPWYTVGVVYNGLGETNLQLGFGSGLSKKEAGEKAAKRAMENKKLIKRLQKTKEDIQAAKVSAPQDYNN
ncbi:ribonuclease III domain-containing protein [Biscogniauxia marginata]|nr:ribonuclease III domain-containing protein [Biscogniauxia marginata]